MKNSWLVWLLVIVAIVTIFAVFNHQSGQKQRALSEIFPTNEEVIPVDVEYEYIDTDITAKETTVAPAAETAAAPVYKSKQTAAQKASVQDAGPVNAAQASNAVVTQVSLPYFTVQIGSFKKESQAQDVVNKLKSAGHDSFIVSRNLAEKGVWYRVYAGKFDSKSDATAYLPKLTSMYKDAFVISPK